MEYILLNITFKSNSLTEDVMDNQILKEFAYGAKFKEPTLEYDNVLIPIIDYQKTPENSFNLDKIKQYIFQSNNINYSDIICYSIYTVFEKILDKLPSINILKIISENDIGIFYTDGSFSKSQTDAAYACCKLLNESQNGLYDDFTCRKFNYDAFSGRISDGTNNIGELTGIKVAIENFSEKPYQLIISDSIYGIKTYREYIYTWKKNGYKAYNKKPIKNKELICETYDELVAEQNKKIVLFKWTKGHANNSFNEKCDELAKKELDL